MKLTRYASAVEFLKHAREPLEKEEAANGLIVGIAGRMAESPDYYRTPTYLATVDEDGEFVAAVVRTPPHNLIVYSVRGADPEPLQLILDDALDYARNNPSGTPASSIPGIVAHAATAVAFSELWAQQTGRPYLKAMSQRIYQLRKVESPKGVPGRLRQARDEDMDLLTQWIRDFNVDAFLPPIGMTEARGMAERRVDDGDLFLWEDDGRPVSMALKTRPTSHGISVSLVYTPRELRNRGYASACVAALSQQLLDAGWQFCTLYTDLSNPTSNAIYQRIGYRPICDSAEYHFIDD